MNNVIIITKDYDINLSKCEDIFYNDEKQLIEFSYQEHTNVIHFKKNELENCVNTIRREIHKAYNTGSSTANVVDVRGYEE